MNLKDILLEELEVYQNAYDNCDDSDFFGKSIFQFEINQVMEELRKIDEMF